MFASCVNFPGQVDPPADATVAHTVPIRADFADPEGINPYFDINNDGTAHALRPTGTYLAPGTVGEIGLGPDGSDPATDPGWTWFSASPQVPMAALSAGYDTWEGEVVTEVIDARDGTRYGAASAWFGDALSTLTLGSRPRTPMRPWMASFDRAEARTRKRRMPRQVYADWIADSLWGLRWTERYSFDLAVADWQTRLAVASECEKRIRAQGTRADRAAAEAVTIVETVGEAESWMDVVRDHMCP